MFANRWAAVFMIPIYINDHLKAGAGVFAVSDMFFAIGALAAGTGIRWIFKKATVLRGIIIMTLLTALIYYFYTFNTVIFLFYLGYFLVGLCNAGTRVLRMTYLFNIIPNSVIGRTGSVFIMINAFLRLLFISLFSLPFFSASNNIIYTFMILSGFLFLSALPLLIKYRSLAGLADE